LFCAADEEFLVERAKDNPHIGVRELARDIGERLGRKVPSSTVAATLKRLGVRKVKPQIAPKVPPAKRYGYTATHRRSNEGAYASSVTDVEWEHIRDLFEHQGPGRPELYSRRELFDAISYVVRSGCAWRMLPKEFPKWTIVYMTFRRWCDAGLFEAMHDRLREMWREREGRDARPTGAVLDSQSVKTSEKGGLTVSMRPKRSRAASATS
jgi:transposase